jgi:hypothetical protein
MNKHHLVHLVGGATNGDPAAFHRVSGLLADRDPKLRSVLWMLREGAIGRRNFNELLSATLDRR